MKKLILFSAILALISCNNLEKKQSEPIHASETVLIVNYKLDNMSLEEHAELGSAVAPSFVSENVPGLLGKSFIGDVDRGFLEAYTTLKILNLFLFILNRSCGKVL